MEAIQPSWEHERMITREDGGIEAIMEDFTLQSCYFALQSCDFALTSQSLRSFTMYHHLSGMILGFRTDLDSGCKVSYRYIGLVRKLWKIENSKFLSSDLQDLICIRKVLALGIS